MQCPKGESVGNLFYLVPKCCLFLWILILAIRLCSGGFYVFTEQMCIIFVACFILGGRDTHIGFLRFVCGPHNLPYDDGDVTISHNNKNRNSLRASSAFNASVKSNCTQPPPPPPTPRWGRKERTNAFVELNPHCSFHWWHSRIVPV